MLVSTKHGAVIEILAAPVALAGQGALRNQAIDKRSLRLPGLGVADTEVECPRVALDCLPDQLRLADAGARRHPLQDLLLMRLDIDLLPDFRRHHDSSQT